MIVELDVAELRVPQRHLVGRLLPVRMLALHRVEERIHIRVVIHLPRSNHALHDTVLAQLPAVLTFGVFDAKVAVKYASTLRIATLLGVAEGFEGQRPIH